MEKEKQNYWKSLEELNRDPEFLREQSREFSESIFSRRDFIKWMGFSVSTVALVACSRSPIHKAIPFLMKPEEITPGVANWYATTCSGCTAGCSILVKNRDGRPIKVEGNPQSPLSVGGVCAVGQSTLLSLYDGSRSKSPLWNGKTLSWDELDRRVQLSLKNNSGKVVFLSGTLTSPTTRQLIADFLTRFPNSQHVVYDPVSYKAIRHANLQNFGESVLPSYRLDKAKLIVGIQADFLGSWLSPVEFTRQYTQNRKLNGSIRLSRHIQFEADYSLTGLNADQRIPILPSEEGLVVLGLLQAVSKLSVGESFPALPRSSLEAELLRKVAQELWEHRGESLVICGSNDPYIQVLVNALNHRLGNIGATIDLDNPSLQKQGDEAELEALIEKMRSGEVGALFIEGVNPLYDFPGAERFKQALAKVPLSLSFSPFPDETASACTALASGLNFLEAWNDAQPKSNLFHLAQPLIAPLFNQRGFQDSLLKWMGSTTDFYAYLKDYWTEKIFLLQSQYLFPVDFWNHTLQDGVFELPPKASGPRDFSGPIAPEVQRVLETYLAHEKEKSAGGYELACYEAVGLREGRHANNPWIQELPDPVTKLTWGNVLKISPREAERLGLKDGDVVRLEQGGVEIEIPIFRQPGLNDRTIALALGYGRKQAGKVGDGVGKNAFPFLPIQDACLRYSLSGVRLTATGRSEAIASTQGHSSMENRPIVKETSLAEYLKNPRSGNTDRPELWTLWGDQWDGSGTQWGMAIDLNSCTGCSACVISCQVENNVPVVGKEEVVRQREMQWMRIDRYYTGSEEKPSAVTQPMFCQHCANAPCETVCPVLATVHSSDGLNQQVYNRCVGTRYCANNCPYKVRRFNWFDYADNPKFDYNLNDSLGKMVLNPDVTVRSRGVMEKCSMCVQRIQETKLLAKQEGRDLKDGEIQTACQQSCPGKAIVFGNLKDPKSEIAERLKNERSYHVLEELNVRPSVAYLTKVRNEG